MPNQYFNVIKQYFLGSSKIKSYHSIIYPKEHVIELQDFGSTTYPKEHIIHQMSKMFDNKIMLNP